MHLLGGAKSNKQIDTDVQQMRDPFPWLPHPHPFKKIQIEQRKTEK